MSNPISGQKFFLKCLYQAVIFLNFLSSDPKSDQKVANFTLFLARIKFPCVSRTPALQFSANHATALNDVDRLSKLTPVIPSISLHCFATVIVYTRSMFISLRLSKELISGYLFPETVFFSTRKK